jgi:hypothetical protein
MTWLFGPSLEDKELERRLRESERAEEEARTRHRAKAINSTIQADDASDAPRIGAQETRACVAS